MMTTQSRTLSAKRKRAVLEAYRARGKRNSNLWLIYSVKTDRDWLLQSDRELVHWVIFLESDPQVVSFDLAPGSIISYDATEARATELDAIVQKRDAKIEYHEVKAGLLIDESAKQQLLAQSSAAQAYGASYKIFCDTDLAPHCKTAVRWLKAIAYAATLRDQTQASCRDALLAVASSDRRGTVRSLLTTLSNIDATIVIGMLVRLSINGPLQLDLTRRSFGYTTYWEWCDGK